MPPRSKLDRLPMQLQAKLGELYRRHTLDEVMRHLEAMGGELATVSRSAVHRWGSKQDEAMAEDLREARRRAAQMSAIAEDVPHSSQAQLNAELLNDEVYRLIRAAREAQRKMDAGELDEAEALDAKGILALARAQEATVRALRNNLEFIKEAERRAAETAKVQAADKAGDVARQLGLSADMKDAIIAGILGVKAAPAPGAA